MILKESGRPCVGTASYTRGRLTIDLCPVIVSFGIVFVGDLDGTVRLFRRPSNESDEDIGGVVWELTRTLSRVVVVRL